MHVVTKVKTTLLDIYNTITGEKIISVIINGGAFISSSKLFRIFFNVRMDRQPSYDFNHYVMEQHGN